jgi:hypothetical protein
VSAQCRLRKTARIDVHQARLLLERGNMRKVLHTTSLLSILFGALGCSGAGTDVPPPVAVDVDDAFADIDSAVGGETAGTLRGAPLAADPAGSLAAVESVAMSAPDVESLAGDFVGPTIQSFEFRGRQTPFFSSRHGDGPGPVFAEDNLTLVGAQKSGAERNAIAFDASATGAYGEWRASFRVSLPAGAPASTRAHLAFLPIRDFGISGRLPKKAPLFGDAPLARGLSLRLSGAQGGATVALLHDGAVIAESRALTATTDGIFVVSATVAFEAKGARVRVNVNATPAVADALVPNAVPYAARVALLGERAAAKAAAPLRLDDVRVDYVDRLDISSQTTGVIELPSGTAIATYAGGRMDLLPSGSGTAPKGFVALPFRVAPGAIQHDGRSERGTFEAKMDAQNARVTWAAFDAKDVGKANPLSAVDVSKATLRLTIDPATGSAELRAGDLKRKASVPPSGRYDLRIETKLVERGSELSVSVNGAALFAKVFVANLFPFRARPAVLAEGLGGGASCAVRELSARFVGATPERLLAIKMSGNRPKFPLDWEIAMLSAQALANSDMPRVFTERFEPALPGGDAYWRKTLSEVYGVEFDEASSPEAVLASPAVARRLRSAVLYDPAQNPMSVNVALTEAGIRRSLLLTPKIAGALPDLPIARDLRSLPASPAETMAWARREQLPLANPVFFATNPGGYDDNTKGLDYVMRNRLMVSLLDSTDAFKSGTVANQKAVLRAFAPTVDYGTWVEEGKDIRFLSAEGHTRLGFAPNNSVFDGFPEARALKQNLNVPEGFAVKPGRRYVLLSFTQGDAFHFCMKDNIRTWFAESRGTLVRDLGPFGLMHTPVQADIQPVVPFILYESQSPRHVFSSKGYGYANPTVLLQNGHLDLYLKRAKGAMQRGGIVDYMINDNNLDTTGDAALKKIIATIKPRSIISKHQFDERVRFDEPTRWIDGVPVFADPVLARYKTVDGEEFLDIDAVVADVKASLANPQRTEFWVFLEHQVKGDDFLMLQKRINAIPNTEVVGLNELVAAAKARRKP